MSLFTPGWAKKALDVRTIVSLSPIVDMASAEIEFMDATKRAHKIYMSLEPAVLAHPDGIVSVELAIEYDEITRLQAEVAKLGKTPLFHEPAEIYGWRFALSLYGRNGRPWWLVQVERKNVPTAKDLGMFAKIMDIFGCDDPERDQVSVNPLADCIAHQIPVLYTWRNLLTLNELQVHATLRGKNMTRIVPRGSRAVNGYQKIEDLKPKDDQ